MFLYPFFKIIGLTDIESVGRGAEDVDEIGHRIIIYLSTLVRSFDCAQYSPFAQDLRSFHSLRAEQVGLLI